MSLLTHFSGSLDSNQQKDAQVSPEILAVVEELKKCLAEQKKQHDEITKSSNKPFDDLTTELTELQTSVSSILSSLRRQSVKCSHLKEEASKLEKNFNLVQRSLDMSCDFAQMAPEINEYFKNCVTSFSNRLQTYKQQVQAVEDSLSSQSKTSLTPKELCDVLRKLDENFMALAAQLYSLNEELSDSKALVQRQSHGLECNAGYRDSSAKSPFDKLLFESEKKSANIPYGPTPFLATENMAATTTVSNGFSASLGVATTTQQPVSSAPTLGFGFSSLKPAASTASPFSLGATTTSAGGFTLGGGFGAPAASAAPATSVSGFSFGLGTSGSQATTTTSSSLFGFGTTTSGTSLFGVPKPSLFGSK